MALNNPGLDRSLLGVDEIAEIRRVLATIPEMVGAVEDFVIHDHVCTETVAALRETMNQITDLRVARMREKVRAGWTRAMIGQVLGLNRGRVDQLVRR